LLNTLRLKSSFIVANPISHWALAWPVKNLGLWIIGVCANFVPFASAVFEIDINIASTSVELVPVGATTGGYIAIKKIPRALRPKSPQAIWPEGRGRRASVFHGSSQL